MSTDTPGATNRTASPYKGLDHFEEEDAPFFFGREVQRDLIIANLIAARLTLLYGESGVGKTSLLNAGVVPCLRDEPDVDVVVFRSWDRDPIAGLTSAIRAISGAEPSTGGSELTETIAACVEERKRDLVIILDQFEEYFVYHPQENGEGTFALEFPRAVNQRELRVSFMISLREDAIARLDRFKGRIPNLFGNYLRVDHLDIEAAREAIERPLEEYERRTGTDRVEIDPELVETVLDKARVGIDRTGQTGVGIIAPAGPEEWQIEAPYLQLVMARLWDEEHAAHSHMLRLETLDRLGGAEQIIQSHLDAAMEQLTDAERNLAARVFWFMVTPSETKIAWSASDLAHYAEPDAKKVGQLAEQVGQLFERLAGQHLRILRGVSDGKYEIYHDVLARKILDWRTRFLRGPRGDIAHVVVLMLQNRSFDHMLGYLPHRYVLHPKPTSDGVLGDSAFDGVPGGPPAFDGVLGKRPFTNPGWAGGPPAATSADAKVVLPAGPDHSHDAVMEQLGITAGKPTNRGFVRSYERKVRGLDPPAFGGLLGPLANLVRRWLARGAPAVKGRGPLVMACQPPEHVPVLSRLASDFAVCTRWFSSVPGGTWPNRNFAHAATSDGQTQGQLRPYVNRTIFEHLESHGVDWRIYHEGTPQAWAFPALWDTSSRHAKWFSLREFADHVASDALPAYTFIEPNYRPPLHALDQEPVNGAPNLSCSQHPENNLVSDSAYNTFTPGAETDFTRAERLIATVYEALRANPAMFARTILLITYDEHGGLYDHVPPPTGVPSPGDPINGAVGRVQRGLLYRKSAAFDFTVLGPRVPAVIVSPRVAPGTIDQSIHDHASIPATLRALFTPSAQPLTRRDAWSNPFLGVLTLPKARTDLPDLSAYTHAAAVTAPPVPAAAGASSAPTEQRVPPHYQPFILLADWVQQHLAAVGEPEAAGLPADGEPMARSAQISQAFAAAADRHRHAR
jgi:phospholipase C